MSKKIEAFAKYAKTVTVEHIFSNVHNDKMEAHEIYDHFMKILANLIGQEYGDDTLNTYQSPEGEFFPVVWQPFANFSIGDVWELADDMYKHQVYAAEKCGVLTQYEGDAVRELGVTA